MNYSEDHIALAAEYALGTLDADERALVETMMIVDHGFMEVVDAWDRKLSPLHQMVAAVEPPPHVWDNIKVAAGLTGRPFPAELPVEPSAVSEESTEAPHAAGSPEEAYVNLELQEETHPTAAGLPEETHAAIDVAEDVRAAAAEGSQVESIRADEAAVVEPVTRPSNVVELAGRKRGGFAYGFIMTAVAASLAGVIALQAYRPDLLPEQLRVKPKVQVVEVRAPAPQPGAQFVAVLQQNATAPAFILTVDTATKNFTVRKVGATPQPGKSFELWLVSDKLQRPRSLGVIGGSDFTIRPALAAYDFDTINKATFAVTVEPEGGSPTGIATGPIVYTGKLVESVPALPPAPPR